jgi:hypothetical protein
MAARQCAVCCQSYKPGRYVAHVSRSATHRSLVARAYAQTHPRKKPARPRKARPR